MYLSEAKGKKIPGRGNSMYEDPMAKGRMGSYENANRPERLEDGEQRSDMRLQKSAEATPCKVSWALWEFEFLLLM